MSDNSILAGITGHKCTELAAAKARVPLEEVQRRAAEGPPVREFLSIFRAGTLAVIAEIKRASPAAGRIRHDLDAAALARQYVAGGADAVSVWTDARYFDGDAQLLQDARRSVRVPVLRKDFILDPYQVHESRAMGADAVLLIAALLETAALQALIRLCADLGMSAPVTVYDEQGLDRAVAAGASILFIHNRDIGSFTVELETTLRLRPRIPSRIRVVSESGIRTSTDVQRLRGHVDGILIGTALMTRRPGRTLADLVHAAGRSSPT